MIVTTEYYCSSNLAQQISSYILVKEIFRIGVTSGMITIFLHRMIAKNLYLENPMSASLASLSKINYLRWRPIWPPYLVCRISASNSPRSVIFCSKYRFLGPEVPLVLLWMLQIQNGRHISRFTCKYGFYCKNSHQLTPAVAWSLFDIDQMFVGAIFLLVFKPKSQEETLVCCQNFFQIQIYILTRSQNTNGLNCSHEWVALSPRIRLKLK